MDEDSLAEALGHEDITYDEYRAALEALRDGEKKINLPTVWSEYLRMLSTDIKQIKTEIREIEAELEEKKTKSKKRGVF